MRWLDDGTIAGQTDEHALVMLDPRTHAKRTLGNLPGEVIDVSPDGRLAAVVTAQGLSIIPSAGGSPVIPSLGTGPRYTGTFSPDGRRLALLDEASGLVRVEDLVAQHHQKLKPRVHVRGFGEMYVRWLDASHLLINGSATAAFGSDIWQLELDARGDWVGPPQILIASEHNTALVVSDIQQGRILARSIHSDSRNFVVYRGVRSLLPTSAMEMYPVALDLPHQRALAATDMLHTRWAWMSLDGTRVTPIVGLDGRENVVIAPWGFALLDEVSDTPVLVALDEGGHELAKRAFESTRARYPRMTCSPAGCVVRWTEDGSIRATFVHLERNAELVSGPVLRFAGSTSGGRQYGTWDVSSDGRWIATMTPDGYYVQLLDVMRGTTRSLRCDNTMGFGTVAFALDGQLLLGGNSDDRSDPLLFGIIRCDRSGHATTVLRTDQWPSAVLELADHKLLVSTRSYQNNLRLFESSTLDSK